MGVIQNSLNQALATVMGGMLGIKHVQGQQAALEKAEIMERADLEAEVPKLKYETLPEKEQEGQVLGKARERILEDVDKSFNETGTISAAQARNLANAGRSLEIAQGEIKSEQLKIKLKESRLEELRKKQDSDIGGNK